MQAMAHGAREGKDPMSIDNPYVLNPSCNVERIMTSSDHRNRALALNIEAGTPIYKIYHSMVIADLALAIADIVARQEQVIVDRDAIEAAALLHDVGISQTEDDLSPQHSIVGAQIAFNAGYSEETARCIETHDLGGLIEDVVRELGLAPRRGSKDTVARTWNERIVAFADLIISYEGEYMLDMWEDPFASAKVAFPYLEIIYRRRLGVQFPRDHPQLAYIVKFHHEMLKYCPRDLYEKFRPGINRMVDSLLASGVPIPPAPVLAEWP